KVKTEAEFHPFFNGGTICHVWIGESRPDPDAMRSLVRKMASTKLAYFTFSPDFSVCASNHVTRGKVDVCPICRKRTDHMNRIVGYFTRTSRWNPGKQQEYADRVRYKI
ncbi:MAG: anaerobic ribonucleoside-triphosphate reductase, partial [Candidatus Aenigmarchaeota archaeon]|nr:anaerobic ribonucleoside-triphosphate reductase [Candidatus Aenigmarchaeota archaeon]